MTIFLYMCSCSSSGTGGCCCCFGHCFNGGCEIADWLYPGRADSKEVGCRFEAA